MRLNPFYQCSQYSVPLWQCPSFLFFILGLANISSILAAFFVSQRHTDKPEIVILIAMGVSLFIFIISYIIVGTFSRLAEANKMKTEFLNIVSHQILTPLTSEKWLANLLLSEKLGKLNNEQKEYIELLKTSNSKSIQLVNNLLNVSRIESNKMAFEKKPVDLKQIAEDVVKEEKISAQSAKVSIEIIDESKDSPLAICDATKIKLVLQNFISNAIKYTKENGQIVIILRKEGDYLKISVIDNGVGIPKEERPFIFQKFFRSNNALRFQTLGSGLGLYISKYIIDTLGGKIGFESEEGKGSKFWFKLPVYKT